MRHDRTGGHIGPPLRIRNGSDLDLFVDEDAQQDADEGEEVHLQREADRDFQEPEIDRHRRGKTWMDSLREHVLNDAGMREDGYQNLAEQAAEQASDDDAGDQDPRRFTHGRTLLSTFPCVKRKSYANFNNEQSGVSCHVLGNEGRRINTLPNTRAGRLIPLSTPRIRLDSLGPFQ